MKAYDYDYIVGIDPGVNTGLAGWHKRKKKLTAVGTFPIHKAMETIQLLHKEVKAAAYVGEVLKLLVRVEDARKRKWFGAKGREALQGAGSIKRDCQIWEEYLKYYKIDYEMVAPKDNKTKLDAAQFKIITGWAQPTNEHGRDAAMLVFGL